MYLLELKFSLDRLPTPVFLGFPCGSVGKESTCNVRDHRVRSLGWEDLLEKGKATHSSILAWRIPWNVQSMGSQKVVHDSATFTFICSGVGFVDHLVVPTFSFFKRTSVLVSIMVVPTYICTNKVERFSFLSTLASIYCSQSF